MPYGNLMLQACVGHHLNNGMNTRSLGYLESTAHVFMKGWISGTGTVLALSILIDSMSASIRHTLQ